MPASNKRIPLTDEQIHWIAWLIKAKSEGKPVQWKYKDADILWKPCLDRGHVWNFDTCIYRVGLIEVLPTRPTIRGK